MKFKKPTCYECGKKIESLKFCANDKNYEMINSAILNKNLAGYGSAHDGSIFQIAFCDSCIDKALKSKKIVKIGDYLFPESDTNS